MGTLADRELSAVGAGGSTVTVYVSVVTPSAAVTVITTTEEAPSG